MMTSLRSGTSQATYRATGRYDHHPITSFIEITFCRPRWNSRHSEGHLMPQKKDQPPPDLRHFNPVGK